MRVMEDQGRSLHVGNSNWGINIHVDCVHDGGIRTNENIAIAHTQESRRKEIVSMHSERRI